MLDACSPVRLDPWINFSHWFLAKSVESASLPMSLQSAMPLSRPVWNGWTQIAPQMPSIIQQSRKRDAMLLWQDAFYSLPQQNGAFECPSSRIHLSGILASSIHVYASIKLTGKIMKFSLVLHFLTQKGGRTKQEEGNVRRSIWSESEPISQTNFCNAIGSFVSIAAAPRHEKNLLSLLKQSQL